MSTVLTQHSVFVDRRRKYARADVMIDGKSITITNGRGFELATYEIDQTVKEGCAWDVIVNGRHHLLVAQEGCGCGGMKRIEPDATYTGDLRMK